MTVRSELPEDRDNALDVERLAFQQARNGDAVEDIVEAIRAVRDEEGSFGLVAELDGVIVGHVQFSRAWIGDSHLVVLGPMGSVRITRDGASGPSSSTVVWTSHVAAGSRQSYCSETRPSIGGSALWRPRPSVFAAPRLASNPMAS